MNLDERARRGPKGLRGTASRTSPNPCALCGASPLLFRDIVQDDPGWLAICPNYGCRDLDHCASGWGASREESVADWNQRNR